MRLWKALIFCLLICIVPSGVQCFAAPDISAQSAIVLEAESGRILYAKNAEKQLPMASTTKIMTAYLALEEGDKNAEITVSEAAASVEGSSMYLQAGEHFTLQELLYGLMLSSGNDAAVAIAEYFGGEDAFVDRMNSKAQEMGLHNTHFCNPNGLPEEEHYSTAEDMARLTAAAMKNPDFAEIVKTKSRTISGDGKAYAHTLQNHNKLLWSVDGCIGVKTGFTKAAGRCLVSAANRDEMTLICVTLNAPDDWEDHKNLYQSVCREYRRTEVLRKGAEVGRVGIYAAEQDLSAVAAESVFYPCKEGEQPTLETSLKPQLFLPVEKGADAGSITVKIGNQTVKTVAAVSGEDATLTEEDGFLIAVKYMVYHLLELLHI